MISNNIFRLGCALVVFSSNCLTQLFGQGSKGDYERAMGLRDGVRNKVFKKHVNPKWSADGGRFWYRNDLSTDRREFVLVDTTKGERRLAFNHVKVAAALTNAIGQSVDAEKLPIDELAFTDNPNRLRLIGKGNSWELDLKTSELGDLTSSVKEPLLLEPPEAIRPSGSNGQETYVTFRNVTDQVIRLVWVSGDGGRHLYEVIGDQSEFKQHTYANHVWLIETEEGKRLGIYEAKPGNPIVIIDGRTNELKKSSAKSDEDYEQPAHEKYSSPRGLRSPDGKWEVLIKEHNLWLRGMDGQHLQLSKDGTHEDGYRKGDIHWSPDSKHLAGLRTLKEEEHLVNVVESSPKDQLQPKLHSFRYLKPGDRVAKQLPKLFNIRKRQEIQIEQGLFNNPWRINRIRWAKNSREFTFEYNERGHQVLRIISVNSRNGKTKLVVEETSNTFIDYSQKNYVYWLGDGEELIWMSERNGWNHLYLFDTRKKKLKNAITQGNWVVRKVEHIDEARRQIWFQVMGVYPKQDPYYIHHCRVNLDGTGLTVLTEGNGTHELQWSPDRRFFVDKWSRVDQPPVHELRSVDGKFICELERADCVQLLKTDWKFPERFTAKGRDGESDIFGVIWRPTNFDPMKRYPVIESIYAGPHNFYVPKGFRDYYGQQRMAELGFILVQIDGMGTNWRSKKFHDVCWQNIKDAGFPDRILWMKAAAKKHPEMDLSIVGIYGGSAGGQNTMSGLLHHGDFYKVGVSDCGCHDNRMDKIWWNEAWMGWPIGPEYSENSNVTHAHKLKGKLLLIVGELDRNVDPASTTQVVNALIKADKDFDFLLIPGTGHGAAGTPYGRRRQMDYFVEHILNMKPRWE